MTLDDMLALLPDNTTGQIGADDLRAIVTGLYQHAWVANAYAYEWTNNPSGLPASNKMNLNWSPLATVLHLSITDGGGVATPLGSLSAVGTRLHVKLNTGGADLYAHTTGGLTNQGNYLDVGIAVDSVVGAAPSANNLMTLITLQEVSG